MTRTRTLRLVSSQSEAGPLAPPKSRFRLFISDRASPMPAIRVYDSSRQGVLLRWQGEVASHLLKAGNLPLRYLTNGSHDCDKGLLRRLTIAAAALQMKSERQDAPEGGDRPHRDIPPLHHCVATLLFDHPDHHFAGEEVVCLMALRYPCIAPRHVTRVLGDLVDWNVIQRIAIDAETEFYDLDTRPHLHVYDARARELRDAEVSGVLRLV